MSKPVKITGYRPTPTDVSPFPDKKYALLLCDPPWRFQAYSGKGLQKSPDRHYPTMTPNQIAALPVDSIAADDAILALWVTSPHLEIGMNTIKSWGFSYRSTGFAWVKTTKDGHGFPIGGGFYTRANIELCLIARRGKGLKVLDHGVRQLIVEPRREHSRKPDRVHDDLVSLFGDVPRIELFAREQFEGWDSWGDSTSEFSSTTEVPPL